MSSEVRIPWGSSLMINGHDVSYFGVKLIEYLAPEDVATPRVVFEMLTIASEQLIHSVVSQTFKRLFVHFACFCSFVCFLVRFACFCSFVRSLIRSSFYSHRKCT